MTQNRPDRLQIRVRVILAALVFSVPLAVACQSACSGTAAQVARDTAADCGGKLATTAITKYAPQVTIALASADYAANLRDLAGTLTAQGIADGFGLLACVVGHVLSATAATPASEPGHAPASFTCDATGCRGGDLSALVRANGREWLLSQAKARQGAEQAPQRGARPDAGSAPSKPQPASPPLTSLPLSPPAPAVTVLPDAIPASPSPAVATHAHHRARHVKVDYDLDRPRQ